MFLVYVIDHYFFTLKVAAIDGCVVLCVAVTAQTEKKPSRDPFSIWQPKKCHVPNSNDVFLHSYVVAAPAHIKAKIIEFISWARNIEALM